MSVELLFIVSRDVSSFIFIVQKYTGKFDSVVFPSHAGQMRSESMFGGYDVLRLYIFIRLSR